MSKFNESLPKGFVVVGIEEKYDDNRGAYVLAHVFTGEKVYQDNYCNCYEGNFDDATIDATPEQIKKASRVYRDSAIDCGKVSGDDTFIGCVVSLARSRKAPNKTPLKVVDYLKGFYRDPDQIALMVEGVKVWVSVHCIEHIIEGVPAFWDNLQ